MELFSFNNSQLRRIRGRTSLQIFWQGLIHDIKVRKVLKVIYVNYVETSSEITFKSWLHCHGNLEGRNARSSADTPSLTASVTPNHDALRVHYQKQNDVHS